MHEIPVHYIAVLTLSWHCGYEKPPLLIICNILWYFVKYSFMQTAIVDTTNHHCGIFWISNVKEQPNSNCYYLQSLLVGYILHYGIVIGLQVSGFGPNQHVKYKRSNVAFSVPEMGYRMWNVYELETSNLNISSW